ncbi:unnamed protein product [Trichobilharzia szidati]|nr:unnamed protein product [Trichobilharzia szidati]
MKIRRSALLYIFTVLFFMILCYTLFTGKHLETESEVYIPSDGPQPIIFIGGYPRSGTTLMRVLLDVHPMIRCGPESRVIPKILGVRHLWSQGVENSRLKAAGLYPEAVDSAVRSFILSIIKHAGENASVLCNKDPLSFTHLSYLAHLFPEAKFVHMVRDGRAVVNSLVKRNVRIRGTPNNTEDKFYTWEKRVDQFLNDCALIGSGRCVTVKYESLVLTPSKVLSELFQFLKIPWDPVVLNHDKAMHHDALSKMEPSTSQVVHPIHLASLSAWASNESALSDDFINSIHENSKILQRLGYANLGIPPNYGTPEIKVANITSQLHKDPEFRRVFGNK